MSAPWQADTEPSCPNCRQIAHMEKQFTRLLRGSQVPRAEAIDKAVRHETTAGLRSVITSDSLLYGVTDLENLYAPVVRHIRSEFSKTMAEQSA